MPKPWAKYEVGFINHDKFRAINQNAICLWLEGKNYADEKLTDGLLPSYEVKHWRFYSKKGVEMLTASCGLKPGTADAYAPLWHAVDGFGYQMHDYLEHNDSRDKALARIAKCEADKAAEAKRKAEWRAAKAALSHGTQHGTQAGQAPDTTPDTGRTNEGVPSMSRDVPSMSRSLQKTEDRDQKTERTLSRERAGSDDLGDRARELLEAYPVWYAQERRGARLPILGGALQWEEAKRLCATWDDARLEKLARVVLNATDDAFIEKSDRGWKVFVTKASWADDRLKQWEIERGVTV